MTAAALPAGQTGAPGRVDPRAAAAAALSAGLASAARAQGLAFIALPAPVVSPAAVIHAFGDVPRVAWIADGLTVVGVGAARELRGAGDARWDELVAGAREIAATVDRRTLGSARPRWIGGAAFAPGAADRAPWQGFGDAWFVLPRWTYTAAGGAAQLVLAVDPGDAGDAARWQSELARLHAAFAQPVVGTQPAIVELHRASAAQWRDQIVAITDAIASGRCAKIVAARTATIALGGPANPAALLAALDHRHTDCVRVLIQPPGGGALVAATPERLISRDGDAVQCDALAGTRSLAGAGGEPAAVRDRLIADASAELHASPKDRREHELVVTAIRDALADCGDVFAPSQPDVRVLRHLVHLHTPFRAQLREPRHVLELVARLHPTPAVGGTPRELAVDWIRTREPVARGWYSAPVGWFDLDGNGDFAVAIRSGVVTGNRAHLWAGAGIVAGSDPDRELAETELKLRALLGAFDEPEGGR